MHKLDRGTAPQCLGNYQHGRDSWGDVGDDKVEIRRELKTMQGEFCAYCECTIPEDRHGHIEHFRQRSRYRAGTFEWPNLFWSCNRSKSCGKHKDQRVGPYDHEKLIKPDEDEPERFFLFVSDGTIHIRSGLSEGEKQRASETLRIFNLNARNGPLRGMRRSAAAGYVTLGLEIEELLEEGVSPSECRAFLTEELAFAACSPFRTVIRHTLLPEALHQSP